MRKTVISTILASAMVLAAGTAYAEKKILLKVPVWFPTSLPALGTSPAWVAKQVNAIGGSIKIKVYEPKKLVPPK